jgi:hypothetical protein
MTEEIFWEVNESIDLSGPDSVARRVYEGVKYGCTCLLPWFSIHTQGVTNVQ